MNNSCNDTLEDLNTVMFEYNKPVVVFITFFMLLGIVGNSLVLFIYLFRMKISTLKIFILYLGFIDMVGCCLGMPLEMIDLILSLMYPSDFLCKSQHLAIYFSCIASVLSLFAIAVERFNRTCRPLARQMLPLHAKWIVVGLTLISLLLALPVGIGFQRENTLINDCVVYPCFPTFPGYWKYYYLFIFSCFVFCLFVTFVLYFFIWKRARLHFQQLEARRRKQSNDESDHTVQKVKRNSSQVNMTVFSITALFVISFLPNFIINMAQPNYSDELYAFIMILYRLWVLNCSLNPIVYGICNSEFRQEFKRILTIEKDTKSCSSAMKTKETDS